MQLPDYFALDVQWKTDSLDSAMREVSAAVGRADLSWLEAEHARVAELEPHVVLSVEVRKRTSASLRVVIHSERLAPERVAVALRECVRYAEVMIGQHAVASARLRRSAGLGAGHYAPEPPLVNSLDHMVLVDDRDVVRAYLSNADAFLGSWARAEEIPARRRNAAPRWLLVRALDALDDVAFKRAVYPQQWQLARIAAPKLTKYFDPDPMPEALEHFSEGAEALNPVGYDEARRTMEFACFVEEGAHIAPREVFRLRAIAKDKALDGHRIDRVIVSFASEAMAKREARPLLDVGVSVVFLAEDGELREIEPDSLL